jgi:hypothetical protein
LQATKVERPYRLPASALLMRYTHMSEKLPHLHGEGVSYSCPLCVLSETSSCYFFKT